MVNTRASTELRKTALVIGTAAKHGPGFNLAQRFADQGDRVFLAGPSLKPVIAAAQMLAARGGDIVPVIADMAIDGEVTALFDHADATGTLGLVAFDAGGELFGPSSEAYADPLDRTWRMIAEASRRVAHAAVRHLGGRGGTVIFATQSDLTRGEGGTAAHVVATAAVHALVRRLGPVCEAYGVRIACIGSADDIDQEMMSAGRSHWQTSEPGISSLRKAF